MPLVNLPPFAVTTPTSTLWNVAGATYDSVSFSVAAQSTAPFSIFIKPDGTILFVLDQGTGIVYQYPLLTPWVISSADAGSVVSFSTGHTGGTISSTTFSSDGTKLYTSGSPPETVLQYTLSTPWDVTTAGSSITYDASAQVTNNFTISVEFNTTGTKMYLLVFNTKTIFQYTLSTPWDISSGVTYDNISKLLVGALANNPQSLTLKPDGTQILIAGFFNTITQLDLGTAFDISSAVYNNNSLNTGTQPTNPRTAFVKPDGTKLYASGATTDTIFQYTL